MTNTPVSMHLLCLGLQPDPNARHIHPSGTGAPGAAHFTVLAVIGVMIRATVPIKRLKFIGNLLGS